MLVFSSLDQYLRATIRKTAAVIFTTISRNPEERVDEEGGGRGAGGDSLSLSVSLYLSLFCSLSMLNCLYCSYQNQTHNSISPQSPGKALFVNECQCVCVCLCVFACVCAENCSIIPPLVNVQWSETRAQHSENGETEIQWENTDICVYSCVCVW